MNKITLGIVAALFSASASASWNIVEIDGLGGKDFYASSINDFGQISGSYIDNNGLLNHAFVTDVNGTNIKDFGSAVDKSVSASHINNSGEVIVNYFDQSNGSSKYFIVDSNGNKTELSTISSINGNPTDINDSGVITGNYFSSEAGFNSFVTGADVNFIKNIGAIPGATTLSTAINNSGQIVGYSASNGRTQAFITNNDGSEIRGLSAPDERYYKNSTAYDINDSGQVAGILSMDNHRWSQAFITGEDGDGIIKLGTLPDAWGGYAVAINDAGQAVGISRDITGTEVGSFIYANGGLTDLSNLPEVIDAGWSRIFVTDINDNGQIIGWGYQENDPDNRHAFLLSFTSDTVFTPHDFFIPNIPEPSTYLMLLAGLGLLGFVGRKKQS